jgi:altronate hydrolase
MSDGHGRSLAAIPRLDLSRMRGYPRQDGRKGIRNHLAVAYLVECAHHVARRIAEPFQEQGAQLIGFPGCYPSDYAHRMLEAMCTHPNVGAVLLVSLGCEEFRRGDLKEAIARSGRPVELMVIQDRGPWWRRSSPGSRRPPPCRCRSASWWSAPNAAVPTG